MPSFLRQIFKRESWLSQKSLDYRLLHVLFMGAVGALIGFVVSASGGFAWPVAALADDLGA